MKSKDMKSKEIKKILITDNEAATYFTDIKGWVSSKGNFFGEDEEVARYDGSTHTVCSTKDCGEIVEKYKIFCDKCTHNNYIKRFNNLPVSDYKNEDCNVIFSDLLEEYFSDESDLYDRISEYCIKNSIDKDNFDESLFRLQPCKEIKLSEIQESDILSEDIFSDYDIKLPREIIIYLDLLNKEINDFKTGIYEPKNKRLSIFIDTDCLDI